MNKILYVEDEPYLAKIVKESLESRGFEVVLVTRGDLALTAFERHEPHICILDVMLPGVDGFSLGQEIRDRDQKTPIIFLTAKNQTDDILNGFAHGGNDYLVKPFSIEELIVRIQNLLQLTAQQEETLSGQTFHFGNCTFNYQNMELKVGEITTNLTHRESELLLILLKDRSDATSRKKILLSIWGDDSFFNSRNLDVYIRKLRKYLKDDPEVKILTLKGVGYRLVY